MLAKTVELSLRVPDERGNLMKCNENNKQIIHVFLLFFIGIHVGTACTSFLRGHMMKSPYLYMLANKNNNTIDIGVTPYL